MQRHIGRRGFSSVLSSVLLILIVVIGMSVAFAYFTGYIKDFQSGRGSSIMELIEVEDVWFKDSGHTINVTIYNYGKVAIKIATIYINNDKVADGDGSKTPAEIPVGGHGYILLRNQALTLDTIYHLKLVSYRGSSFEGKYRSPLSW